MNAEYCYGICGVFCEQCKKGNGRVKDVAETLDKLTEGIEGFHNLDFDPDEYRKALHWMQTGYTCPTCMQRDYVCEVRKCSEEKGVESCLLCSEYLGCKHTEHMRTLFPVLETHYRRVKEVGINRHFDEEREKARDGLLLDHLRKE